MFVLILQPIIEGILALGEKKHMGIRGSQSQSLFASYQGNSWLLDANRKEATVVTVVLVVWIRGIRDTALNPVLESKSMATLHGAGQATYSFGSQVFPFIELG